MEVVSSPAMALSCSGGRAGCGRLCLGWQSNLQQQDGPLHRLMEMAPVEIRPAIGLLIHDMWARIKTLIFHRYNINYKSYHKTSIFPVALKTGMPPSLPFTPLPDA